jgi:hypothetical protein
MKESFNIQHSKSNIPAAMPEELLAAYCAASGIPVSMSRQRLAWLREICAMPSRFTPEDVRAVLGAIRAHLRRGTQGWVEESLLFGNAMNPETFEDRALLCRQKAARKAPKPAPPVARTIQTGDGTVTVLDAAPAPEAAVPVGKVLPHAWGELKKKLAGPSSELAEGAGETSNTQHPTPNAQ